MIFLKWIKNYSDCNNKQFENKKWKRFDKYAERQTTLYSHLHIIYLNCTKVEVKLPEFNVEQI